MLHKVVGCDLFIGFAVKKNLEYHLNSFVVTDSYRLLHMLFISGSFAAHDSFKFQGAMCNINSGFPDLHEVMLWMGRLG